MACGNCGDARVAVRRVILQAVTLAISRAIDAQRLAAPKVIPPMGDIIAAAERDLVRLLPKTEV